MSELTTGQQQQVRDTLTEFKRIYATPYVPFSQIAKGDYVMNLIAPGYVVRKVGSGDLALYDGTVLPNYGERFSSIQKITKADAHLILSNWDLYRWWCVTTLDTETFISRLKLKDPEVAPGIVQHSLFTEAK